MAWLDQAGGVLGSCMAAFGEDVEFTPSGGEAVNTIGVFDSSYEMIDPNTGAIVSSLHPLLGVKNADLPRTPLKGDTLSVRGISYRVIEVQQDGHGGSDLLLHKI